MFVESAPRRMDFPFFPHILLSKKNRSTIPSYDGGRIGIMPVLPYSLVKTGITGPCMLLMLRSP
ncbi:MAG: hypothetical protein KAI88_03320, partial [Nitrosomonadaceae bacterium]|nr:hypothetical protein [Nitrosomonadaceae bacterium]